MNAGDRDHYHQDREGCAIEIIKDRDVCVCVRARVCGILDWVV